MVLSKKYILTVPIASAFFIGVFLIWIGSTNPRATASNSISSNALAGITPIPNITIVPAVLNQQGIPAKLGSVSLSRVVTGTAALGQFAQLHGKSFDLVDGYEAHYGSDQAVLWVGQAKDAAGAQAMLEQMAEKIGPDNTMFKNLQALNISGRTLYSAVGQGQQHFFYAVNDKIVWLAANDSLAPDLLHSLWSAVK